MSATNDLIILAVGVGLIYLWSKRQISTGTAILRFTPSSIPRDGQIHNITLELDKFKPNEIVEISPSFEGGDIGTVSTFTMNASGYHSTIIQYLFDSGVPAGSIFVSTARGRESGLTAEGSVTAI